MIEDHAVGHPLIPFRYRDQGLVVDSVHIALDVSEVDGGLFQPEGLDGVTPCRPRVGSITRLPFPLCLPHEVHESLMILPGYLSKVEGLFKYVLEISAASFFVAIVSM